MDFFSNMGEVNNDNKNNEENHLPLIENETENDYNSYKRVLNMTTHNDTLYAYYYTNNHQDNIKNVQDLIDISKNINTKRTELNRQRETTPDSLVNNWSNLQSGKIFYNIAILPLYSICLLHIYIYIYINIFVLQLFVF